MKTRTILMMSAVAALSLNSCSKEEMGGQTQTKTNQPAMTAQDETVYHSILNFKKKVDYIKEHPEYKSGEEMSVDSAQWYLDASINFTYSFIFDEFTGFHTDSVFFEVPVDGGLVNLDDVSAAYFEMYNKLHEVYEAAPGDDKALYNATTEITDVSATTITFKSTATFGERGAQPPEEQPFIEGDDWKYGDHKGYCFPPPYIFDKDAATEIAKATVDNRDLYINDIGDGWHAYYTGPIAIIIVSSNYYLFDNPDDPGTPNYPEQYDNIRDKLMMYQNIEYNLENYTECIYWEEMNFYYFGTHDVIYSIIYDHPELWPDVQGKWFVEVGMAGHANFTGSTSYELYHDATITYKTRHIVADEVYPIEM